MLSLRWRFYKIIKQSIQPRTLWSYAISKLKATVGKKIDMLHIDPYLVDVTFIIVHVQYAVKLCITAHSQLALSAQTSCTFPG